MRTWAWFLISLAVSVALTLLLWRSIGPGLALVFALPFLFLPRSTGRPCPACGRTWPDTMSYCPQDGSPLERSNREP